MTPLSTTCDQFFKHQGMAQGHLFQFNQLPSTNTWAKAQAHHLSHGDVIWALSQTQGRGRRGRHWHSQPGSSLTFSVCIQLEQLKDIAKNITQIAAISLVDLLNDYGIKAEIKWPNDILVGKKKIAGLLAELTPWKDSPTQALILGIGINVNCDPSFLGGIEKPATSLKLEIGKKVPPRDFLENYLTYLESYLHLYVSRGFAVFFDTWKQYCQVVGKEIHIALDGDIKPARVIQLLPDGGLEVKLSEGDGEKKKIYSGDVL